MNEKDKKIIVEKLNDISVESLELIEALKDADTEQYMNAYRINQIAHQLKKLFDN